MPASGSAKPSAPPAPGDPNELAPPNGQSGTRLHEPERELHFAASCTRRRTHASGGMAGAASKRERLRAEPQLVPAVGKDAVGVRDAARRADGAAGRHLQIARVDMLARRCGSAVPGLLISAR